MIQMVQICQKFSRNAQFFSKIIKIEIWNATFRCRIAIAGIISSSSPVPTVLSIWNWSMWYSISTFSLFSILSSSLVSMSAQAHLQTTTDLTSYNTLGCVGRSMSMLGYHFENIILKSFYRKYCQTPALGRVFSSRLRLWVDSTFTGWQPPFGGWIGSSNFTTELQVLKTKPSILGMVKGKAGVWNWRPSFVWYLILRRHCIF